MVDVNEMPVRTHVSSTDKLFRVESEAICIGTDVLVYLWGGERPHIGSVAVAQSRPSLTDPSRTRATASVITFPGHKEDVLVKEAAERIASELDVHGVVTAGIHWDDLNEEGINAIVANSREVVGKLLQILKPGDA